MTRSIGTISLIAAAFATTARASMFNFDFSFVGDSGSGTFVATYDTLGNDYLVTAITGTSSAFGTITGLLPADTFGGNDNLLFSPDAPYLDDSGIAFTVAGAGDDGLGNVNVYYDDSSGLYTENSAFVGLGTFTVTPVSDTPEPGPTALLLAGLTACVGVSLVRARRSRGHLEHNWRTDEEVKRAAITLNLSARQFLRARAALTSGGFGPVSQFFRVRTRSSCEHFRSN